MIKLNVPELERILDEIQRTGYSDVDNIPLMLDFGVKIQAYMAFTSGQVAAAKEELHKARKQGYINLVASMTSQKKQIGPMLMKDYVNDVCHQENFNYTLADRCNSACIHSLDLIRSVLSTMKAELQANSFQPSS